MAEKTRQERIENGTLVPNSFQHPNMYVDWLHFYLTPEEVVVLDKAIREILGWEEHISDRKARIALSVFVNGKVGVKSGKQLCLGCGLGLQATRKALAALNRYRILVKDGRPTQEGQMFRLQDKAHHIDWDGLEERRRKWDEANEKRTKSATKASLAARGLTSDAGGNVARYPNPLGSDPESTTTPDSALREEITSDVGTSITSDVNKETQKDLYSICDDKDLLWEPILADLELQMTKATFDTWLSGSHLVATENGTWTVQVVSPYAVDWLNNRLRKVVDGVMERHAPETEIVFIAKGEPQ